MDQDIEKRAGENSVSEVKETRERSTIEERTNLRELLNLLSLSGILYSELDRRLDIRTAIRENLRKRVPPHVNFWFCLGGISFMLICILVATGILLLFYYQPSVDNAHRSVVHITNNVPFGWLVRGAHHWAANLLIVTVILHMFRVFIHGAYKPPRDFNWVTGCCLLMLVLAMGFTGYLLPWSQVSYWATTIGTELPGAVPVVGPMLMELARGGTDIGQSTLTRFFALHVVILPAVLGFLLVFHFLMIRRQGISGPL
jgi:quinol-cytochrome oxidoreductase complex cytochrome b subunit